LAPGGHADELKKWFRRQANNPIRPSDPVPAPNPVRDHRPRLLCASPQGRGGRRRRNL